MKIEERYKKRYKAGDIPWDIGKPDFNLIQTVSTMAVTPCKTLDIGCGTLFIVTPRSSGCKGMCLDSCYLLGSFW